MIVIPVEKIVQWRRTYGPVPGRTPEKQINEIYVPSGKGTKSKKRVPTSVLLDESLGIKSADVAASDQVKMVRVSLNRLSPENIREVQEELHALKISGLETLRSLGRLFVSKVLKESVFWENYVTLIDELRWCVDEWTLRDSFLVEVQRLFEKIEELDKADALSLMRFLARLFSEGWIDVEVYGSILGKLLEKQASLVKIEYAIVFLKACPVYPDVETLKSQILSRPSLSTRLRMLLVCK